MPCVEPLSYSRGTARLRYSLDSFVWKCVRVLGHVSCCSLDLPLWEKSAEQEELAHPPSA